MRQPAETVAQETVPVGTLQTVYKKCGKPGCKCTKGKLHGPYFRRVWRDEFGGQRSAYVKKADAGAVRKECRKAQRARQKEREERDAGRELYAALFPAAAKALRKARQQHRAFLRQYGLKSS